MRRGLIDSLKFPVAEPDYRYDRLKKGEGKKTRDLEEGNGRNQREKKMRAAIDGSASLMRVDVLAFVRVLFVCVRVYRCSHTHTHTLLQQCLISILSGNRQVTLRRPVQRCVAQEHIVL